MPQTMRGWESEVDRGPNWLFVRMSGVVTGPSDSLSLAHTLRSLLEQHFTYRLVLELDGIGPLDEHLIEELVLLSEWIRAHDGVLRLCGLSPYNKRVLCRLVGDRFPPYRDREEAVFGSARPRQPR